MVLDTTYHNKEHKQLIEDVVGEPFSLFEALRRGGIGSKRLIVNNFSPNLNFITNSVSNGFFIKGTRFGFYWISIWWWGIYYG